MSAESRFKEDVIDEVLQWSAEKIYSVFGSFLNKVVEDKKQELRQKLKMFWKNKHCYVFRDTGEQLDDYAMLVYFNPKKISKYNLADMEDILDKLDREISLSSPKRLESTYR